jgi:hypothetical protein
VASVDRHTYGGRRRRVLGIIAVGFLALMIVMIRTAAAQRARGHGPSESLHWMRWIEGLVSGRSRRRP